MKKLFLRNEMLKKLMNHIFRNSYKYRSDRIRFSYFRNGYRKTVNNGYKVQLLDNYPKKIKKLAINKFQMSVKKHL